MRLVMHNDSTGVEIALSAEYDELHVASWAGSPNVLVTPRQDQGQMAACFDSNSRKWVGPDGRHYDRLVITP